MLGRLLPSRLIRGQGGNLRARVLDHLSFKELDGAEHEGLEVVFGHDGSRDSNTSLSTGNAHQSPIIDALKGNSVKEIRHVSPLNTYHSSRNATRLARKRESVALTSCEQIHFATLTRSRGRESQPILCSVERTSFVPVAFQVNAEASV